MRSSQSLRFEDPDFMYSQRSAYAYAALSEHPSSIRVLTKSLHLLALGWIVSVGYLWISLQQNAAAVDQRILIYALTPLLFIEALAWMSTSWNKQAAARWQRHGEWRHAFWWSLVPNLLLMTSLFLILNS